MPLAQAGDIALEVWSLGDRERPALLSAASVAFRTAEGSRVAFASFGLRPGATDAQTLFVVTHLHLLPVLLPLMYRGARVAALLLGIEAWTPLKRLTARALRQCWRVLAISQHTIERFRSANPPLADLTVNVCAPGAPLLPAPAQTSGVADPSRPYALMVGRMAADERYKGHDELIRVWDRVQARASGARLVIAGTGDDAPRLSDEVKRRGLADAIVFVGRVSASRLAALYRDARFFAMPSRNEGFGLVYLEAMQMGKPCVVAPGAAEEIVEANVQGLVVDPSNDDALIDALVRLFVDDALCARMAAAAEARVMAGFAPAQFSERAYEALDLRRVPVAC